MTRFTFLSLAVLIALCACATPNEIRNGTPVMHIDSGMPAKDVALCIVTHWENSGFGGTPNVTFRPTESGYTVAVRNEVVGSTQLLADIHETQSGSSTRYFKGAVLGEGAFDKAVSDCQQP